MPPSHAARTLIGRKFATGPQRDPRAPARPRSVNLRVPTSLSLALSMQVQHSATPLQIVCEKALQQARASTPFLLRGCLDNSVQAELAAVGLFRISASSQS